MLSFPLYFTVVHKFAGERHGFQLCKERIKYWAKVEFLQTCFH